MRLSGCCCQHQPTITRLAEGFLHVSNVTSHCTYTVGYRYSKVFSWKHARVNKREDMLYLRSIPSTQKPFFYQKSILIFSKLCEVQNSSNRYKNIAQKVRKFHQSLITITLLCLLDCSASSLGLLSSSFRVCSWLCFIFIRRTTQELNKGGFEVK